MASPAEAADRSAGIAQGLTIIMIGFFPVLAIVTLTAAVPTIIGRFGGEPNVGLKVPLLVSAPGLSIAIMALFAGWLVDRFGRRRLIIAAAAIYGVFGVAPFFLGSLDAIIASRLLLGASEAMILTSANTLIADYWDLRGRRRWLALQGVAGPVLATLVVWLSGPMTAWRWNGVFLVYLIAAPAVFAVAAFIYEPKTIVAATREEQPDFGRFPFARVATIAAVTLFSSSLFYVFIINGGLAFQEVGVTDPRMLSKIIAGCSVFVFLGSLIYWLIGLRAPALQIGVFLALLGLGLAGVGLARDVWSMAAALAIQQTGAGMVVPILIGWAQRNLPVAYRGRGMGVWTSAFFLGQFTSPIFVNLLKVETGSMQGAFAVAGVAGVVGAAVCAVSALRRAHSEPAVAA